RDAGAAPTHARRTLDRAGHSPDGAGPALAITVADPHLEPASLDLALEVLHSGRLTQGDMVRRFESLCCEMAGTTEAVAMANGTVTLEAIFELLGIGPGDEVITTPVTFVATVNAALRTGASVRFADVTPDHTVDPAAVASLVNERTRAIVPVHLY